MTETFTQLSTFSIEAWIRMAGRTVGVMIGTAYAAYLDITDGMKKNDWFKVGKAAGKLFQQLFDSAL